MKDDSTKPDIPAHVPRTPRPSYIERIRSAWQRVRWAGVKDERAANTAAVLEELWAGDAAGAVELAELARRLRDKRNRERPIKARDEMIAALDVWEGREPSPESMADEFLFLVFHDPNFYGGRELGPDDTPPRWPLLDPDDDQRTAQQIADVSRSLTEELDSSAAEANRGLALARAGYRALGLDDTEARTLVKFWEQRVRRAP